MSNGLFTVTLNDASEFGPESFNGEERWLEITVDGVTLTPRQPITAAPYALYAATAGTVNSGTASASGWFETTTSPAGRLSVNATPVSATVAFGLRIVKFRLVAPLSAMLDASNVMPKSARKSRRMKNRRFGAAA